MKLKKKISNNKVAVHLDLYHNNEASNEFLFSFLVICQNSKLFSFQNIKF